MKNKNIIVNGLSRVSKEFKSMVSVVSISVLVLSGLASSMYAMNNNAEVEVTNEFLDQVIEDNKDNISDEDKKLFLMSSEAEVKEIKKTFVAGIHLSEKAEVRFMRVGAGTLVVGQDKANVTLLLEIESGLFCRAETNNDGKFGCMFNAVLSEGDIKATYK